MEIFVVLSLCSARLLPDTVFFSLVQDKPSQGRNDDGEVKREEEQARKEDQDQQLQRGRLGRPRCSSDAGGGVSPQTRPDVYPAGGGYEAEGRVSAERGGRPVQCSAGRLILVLFNPIPVLFNLILSAGRPILVLSHLILVLASLILVLFNGILVLFNPGPFLPLGGLGEC